MSAEDFKKILIEVLEERRGIDAERHRQEHDFVALMIEDRRRKTEQWEAIRSQIYGWGIIVFLGAIGTAVYVWAVQFIRGVR